MRSFLCTIWQLPVHTVAAGSVCRGLQSSHEAGPRPEGDREVADDPAPSAVVRATGAAPRRGGRDRGSRPVRHARRAHVLGGPGTAAGRRDVPQLRAQCGGRRRAGLGAERQPVRGHTRPRARPGRRIPGSSPSSLQRVGRAAVVQDGRHCMVGPGDLVNYVTSRPYEVTFWEPYEVVVVTVPLAALGSHTDTLAGRTRDRGRDGSRAPATSSGRSSTPSPRRSTTAPRVTRTAARSTSRTRSSRWSSPNWSTSSRRARATTSPTACSRTAWRTCPIPGLTVESVGRALGVSVRYLHKVLAPTGIDIVGLDPQAAAGTDRPRPRRRVAARAHRGRDRRPLGDARHRTSEPRPEGRVRHDRERDPPVGPLGTGRAPPAAGTALPGNGLTGRHRQSTVDTTVPSLSIVY